jgi:hypothetical protein
VAQGRGKDMSVYRIELAGVYATVQLIKKICDYYTLMRELSAVAVYLPLPNLSRNARLKQMNLVMI